MHEDGVGPIDYVEVEFAAESTQPMSHRVLRSRWAVVFDVPVTRTTSASRAHELPASAMAEITAAARATLRIAFKSSKILGDSRLRWAAHRGFDGQRSAPPAELNDSFQGGSHLDGARQGISDR